MKSSPILPLVALCALSLQPSYAASAAQPPSASSSYWDHIVGGPGTNAAVWYVPPPQMTAYIVARDSSVNTRIRFGNYYQFTCTNGTFNGPTTVSMEKLTPAGWIPLYSPSNSIMSGTISPPPAGVIGMTIITPPQGDITSPLTNYAKGRMIFVAGEWRMTMQTTLPSNPLNPASPPYILQWANMTKLSPRQQVPSLGQAKDDAALRSRQYAWLQDTEWSVQNSALFDGAAQSFRINTYTAGYFFGSSTGPDPFWVSGTVAPDGSLYIVFSAAADGLPDGIYLAQVGSIGRSAGNNWSMVFSSYPPGPTGPEYFGYASLIGSRLTPEISYDKILRNNESVTGVRGYNSKQVVLTGSYLNKGKIQGLWWLGSLDTGRGTYYKVAPKFPRQTVTSSLFYGPNTALFDPTLGAGNVRIVGSYEYKQGASNTLNHGMMFTGSLDGSKGNWTQIDVPTASLTNVGVSVCNTIPHSTMGDLVVGNYDLTTNTSQPIPNAGKGNAFIYHITSKTWTILAPTNAGTAPSGTTAYGIWQNGSNSSFYTIAGGASSNGTNTAFLVDYNADTRTFNNLTYFADTNTPGFTHFEGITGRDGGYNLIATTTNGPAFVSVDRTAVGFSAAKWTPLNYPGSTMTTGNTVYQNYGLGIFFGPGGLSLETSYVARIKP